MLDKRSLIAIMATILYVVRETDVSEAIDVALNVYNEVNKRV